MNKTQVYRSVADRFRFFNTLILAVLFALSFANQLRAQEPREKTLLTVTTDRLVTTTTATERNSNRDGTFAVWSSAGGAEKQGLHLINLHTKEDQVILEGIKDWGVGMFGLLNLQFSPDGSTILFRICPPNGSHCDGSRLYTIGKDGENLTLIAESLEDEKTNSTYEIRSATFSPDGKKIMVGLQRQHAEQSKTGEVQPGAVLVDHFIGLLSSDKQKQVPEIVAAGTPLFWSSDGKTIYFSNGGMKRVDSSSHDIAAVSAWNRRYHIIGKLVGSEDNVFVYVSPSGYGSRCPLEGCTVQVVNLDGQDVDPKLSTLANSIPVQDASHRNLQEINQIGPNSLRLKYMSNGIDTPERPAQHIQEVTYQ